MRNKFWKVLSTAIALAGLASVTAYAAAPPLTWYTTNVGSATDPAYKGTIVTNADKSITLTGGGSDIWNNADGFFFFYTLRTNDFDAQILVTDLQGPDGWSKCEFMMRWANSNMVSGVPFYLPAGGDPHYSVCATRMGGQNEVQTQWRATRGGGSGNAAATPVFRPMYPNQWLRLTRIGNQATVYAGYDGDTWTQLHQQDLAALWTGANGNVPSVLTVGLGVTAHNNSASVNATARVGFVPFTDVPPIILNILPFNLSAYVPINTNFTFTIKSKTAGIDGTGVTVSVNGTLATTLQFGGDQYVRTVTLPGPFTANTFYKFVITAIDKSENKVTSSLTWDTFAQSNFSFEAEDFNFGGGQFLDTQVLASLPAANNYMDKTGVQNVDRYILAANTSTARLYRSLDTTTMVGEWILCEANGDINRTVYANAQAIDPGIVDCNVGGISTGMWMNYTRTIPNATYKVYARVASPNDSWRVNFGKVLTDPTQPNQQVADLGLFTGNNTGGWQSYGFFPLTDFLGNEVVLPLSGVNTLRASRLTGNGMNLNFFSFVPITGAGTLTPYVATVTPRNGVTSANPNLNIIASVIDRSTKVDTTSVQLYLNGTNVPSSGLSVVANSVGAMVNYQSSEFLTAGANYTAQLVYKDKTSSTLLTNSWVFTISTSYPIIPAAYALPESSADTANPGFTVRVSQGTDGGVSPARIENQLSGSYRPWFTQGFDTPRVINYWGNGGHPGGYLVDAGVPNFPGVIDDGNNAPGTAIVARNNIALEAIAYIPLKRGSYTFGVNSDDDFRLSTGTNAQHLGVILGEITGGRGIANSDLPFLVETNGLYPFRLVFDQGGGGYALYFYSLDNGVRTLINDSTNGNPFKAYRFSTVVPATTVTIATQPTNQTILAYTPLRLSVRPQAYGGSITNPYVFFIQWQKNGVDVPGAYGPDLVFPWPSPADSGAWRARVTLGGVPSVLSSTATVVVNPDTTAPTIVSARASRDQQQVVVSFSKALNADSLNTATFTITPTLFISGISLVNYTNVVLTVSQQVPGVKYTVSVTGVTDMSLNAIVADSKYQFTGYVLVPGFAIIDYFYNAGTATTVAGLTGSAQYQANAPSSTIFNSTMQTPNWSQADNYGGRITAVVNAPVSGDYIFYTSSDDDSALYISTDDSPINLGGTPIATVSGWTNQREWGKYASQRSAPVTLTAGQNYFMQGLWKDGGGGDGQAIGWIVPGGSTNIVVVPATSLFSLVNPDIASVTITNQPVSVTISQNRTATFVVGATGLSEFGTTVTYQWTKDNTAISGATGARYTTPLATLADNAAVFNCLVTVPTKTVKSDNAVLTVNADAVAPTVVSAGSLSGSTTVGVKFDEMLDAATATNSANYIVSLADATNAVLQFDNQTVILYLNKPVVAGATVTVKSVNDLTLNTIATVAVPITIVSGLVDADVGTAGTDPLAPGLATAMGADSFVLNSGGHDIWDAADGMHFLYKQVTGDFEAVVRVGGVSWANGWSKAGLMVRETLAAGSRNTAVLGTPNNGQNVITSQQRAATDGASASAYPTQPAPLPYPNVWLKLTRVGDNFYTFTSFDGTAWTAAYTNVVNATNAYPAATYVGLAGTSHNNVAVGTANAYSTSLFSEYKVTVGGGAATPLSMTAVKSGSNVIISWPSASGSLYSTGSLPAASTAWTQVTSPAPVVANGVSTVTIPLGTGKAFYIVK